MNKTKLNEQRLLLNQQSLRLQKQNIKESKGKELKKSFLGSFLLNKEAKRYTTEDTLPFEKMYASGICQVNKKLYSKSFEFADINYQLALDEDKDLVFDNFCKFINAFDANVQLNFTYTNQYGRNKDVEAAIELNDKHDDFDDLRSEFRNMLQNQLAKGNNGLKKQKFLTVTVEADNLKEATTKLERLEIDVMNNFKIFGVKSRCLNGLERLENLHNMLNPSKKLNTAIIDFNKSTKSYIVPNRFNFTPKNEFSFDNYVASIKYLKITASELSDRMLAEFLSVNENLNISLQIKPLNQEDAVLLIKHKNTDIDKMKIDENKKAVKAGYDMDILPSDLITYGDNLKALLTNVQTKDEKLFVVTIILMPYANNLQKLASQVAQLQSIASKHNCVLKNLEHQQEEAFVSLLPIGINKLITHERYLTTSATAIFLPFTTKEIFVNSPTSLYYGLNALSHNLIMADRKFLKNPNGLILGTPGSGKSFAAKREMSNAILVTDDDVIICDPEGEYKDLVKQFNGEVIKVSAKSKNYLNPLDINSNYGDGDAPLKDKANFIMSMFELVVGGEGLTATEKSVIDRCLPKIYSKYLDNPVPENLPILEDLYTLLKEQKEEAGQKLATEMEIYVKGSLNVFNHHSNVNLHKKLLCFDIKELGTQLKKIGMLIIQDQVWNKVSENRDLGRKTRYYIDEFHLLLKESQTAAYSIEIWKRFRKWGGIPTGITQNVKDLLMSKEVENIFDNTDFILMLNQAAGDREILKDKLALSQAQMNYVTNSFEGEGLIFFGDTIVPFVDKFPKNTVLYRKMTTKPEEIANGNE